MMKLSRICGALPALWLAFSSCSAPERSFQNTGGSNTGGSSTGGSSAGGSNAGGQGGTGGLAACPSSHTCVVEPAAGWSAPVAVAEGTPPPSCPADYPDVVLDAKNDVTFGPAACDCACGAPDVDCGPLQLLWFQSCAQPVAADQFNVPPDTCTMAVPKHVSVRAMFTSESINGPCPAQPGVLIDPPVFDTSARACGGATQREGCEGTQVCVPNVVPPFTSICVYRQGDHPCPPGYLVKTTHYAGVNDTRGCTDCICTNPNNVSCSTTVIPYSDPACTMPKTPTLKTDTECIASFGAFTYEPPTISGSCTAGSVAPIGDVELTDPHTICCAE